MSWPTCTILLLTSISLSGAKTTASDPDEGFTVCDENWIFYDGLCYFFSDVDHILNPKVAPEKCLLSDAKHAYPLSPEELSFLQSQLNGKIRMDGQSI